MKKVNLLLVLFIAGIVSLSSCKKDEVVDDNTLVNSTIKTGEISLSLTELYKDQWVYFSFVTQAEVAGIDSTNYTSKTNWDLAFHSRLGRTNSGSSGTGSGGVYDAGNVEFSSITSVNTTGYAVDDTVSLISGIQLTGPTYKDVSGNETFDSAFDVDYAQHPPEYTPANHVYVIKTAEGKYAKILINSFFDAEGESGHITFKYAYQTNGSTAFE